MNYKVINESTYKHLLGKKSITIEEINIYSFYLFGIEKYLDKKLYLTDLNNNFKKDCRFVKHKLQSNDKPTVDYFNLLR